MASEQDRKRVLVVAQPKSNEYTERVIENLKAESWEPIVIYAPQELSGRISWHKQYIRAESNPPHRLVLDDGKTQDDYYTDGQQKAPVAILFLKDFIRDPLAYVPETYAMMMAFVDNLACPPIRVVGVDVEMKSIRKDTGADFVSTFRTRGGVMASADASRQNPLATYEAMRIGGTVHYLDVLAQITKD